MWRKKIADLRAKEPPRWWDDQYLTDENFLDDRTAITADLSYWIVLVDTPVAYVAISTEYILIYEKGVAK